MTLILNARLATDFVRLQGVLCQPQLPGPVAFGRIA